jgi:hypothetical protein
MVCDDRHQLQSVATPWDSAKNLFLGYDYDGSLNKVKYSRWEDTLQNTQGRAWVILPWASYHIGQHKTYRRCGDYAKLIDDLREYHAVAFEVEVTQNVNGSPSMLLITKPKAYVFQMWDGDMRSLETIAIQQVKLTKTGNKKYIAPLIRKFLYKTIPREKLECTMNKKISNEGAKEYYLSTYYVNDYDYFKKTSYTDNFTYNDLIPDYDWD